MRADRLLSIMMLLQGHGQMTARQLSEELEVSERTIYRDIDALSGAGVPVYGERGP
ncbi:MAG: helix-turn-helix transcriptional regulator [Anaerolineae bacterium]